MKKNSKKIDSSIVWREARELIAARRGRLLLGLVLMVAGRLAGLVMPFSTGGLATILEKGNWETLPVIYFGFEFFSQKELLYWLSPIVLIAILIQATISFSLARLLGVMAQRAVTEMRKRIQSHIARIPISYFDSTPTGVLISRIMTDADGIRNLIGSGLIQIIGSTMTAFLAVVILLWIDWKLTLFTLLALVIFGGCLAFAFGKLRPLFRRRGKINAEVTGRLNEFLNGIRIVKSYGAEKREELVFARGVHQLLRNVTKGLIAVSAVQNLTKVLFSFVAVFIMVVGGVAYIDGRMLFPDLVMYVAFTGMVIAPVAQIASIGTQITDAFAGLDRIREVMSMDTEDDQDQSRDSLSSIEGKIEFDGVSFEYDDGVPVLKNVSFLAPAGTTTALVGSSGSGKSTLISLVMTFNRPKAGRILLDGKDLAEIKLRDYRSYLGIVLQDNFLFDGSIKENLRYSRPNASDEEVIRVSHIAHCHEFISRFDDGYDTKVGERGVKLSGGQRQRIAIARAILADPKILILDEATSSLDSESEAYIQDGLRTLQEGRTSFVIAHRLSTILGADQILVLEHGEIVERGTHSELIALEGRYKTLHDKQYDLEQNRFINPGEEFENEPEDR